jgi:hypothetical protein
VQAYYTMLQAVVMLMLVIRLISHLMVQPRLAVISATLAAAAVDISYLLLGPLAVCMVMSGAALCIGFYWLGVSAGL